MGHAGSCDRVDRRRRGSAGPPQRTAGRQHDRRARRRRCAARGPGITTAELTCLAADLRAAGLPVVAGFATHPDWDHALWHPDHGDAPRYGTARCAAEPAQLRADPAWADHVAQALPPEFADEPLLDGFGLVTGLDGDAVPWDGPTVRVVEHPRTPPATLRCSSRTAAC
jgi:hypothetical protein